jgi:hypothetical protein
MFEIEDLSSYAIAQDFNNAPVMPVPTRLPVHKPPKDDFVRISSDPGQSLRVFLLSEPGRGDVYLVHPRIVQAVPEERLIQPFAISLAIGRRCGLFLWPRRFALPSERGNDWWDSLEVAATKAQTHWLRVTSNVPLGRYEITAAVAAYQLPVWPERSMHDLLNDAFADRVIEDLDHPILQTLRGEI